ncbi:MAG TPA: hypothetical protein VGP50_02585 [Stellaceae bacterium]|jgi:hypothetical protein|nr:hypothetical protein [Stellaceae bacterium]
MTPPDEFLVVDSEKFDLAATERLFELFAVPRGEREEVWLIAFRRAAWNASVVLPTPQVMTGPDGFPYLRLVLPPPGEPFQSNCLSNVCAFCAERGLGVAYFASEADPPIALQYAIPTGVIESLCRFGSWAGDPLDGEPPPEDDRRPDAANARQALVGAPSADYLPPHTARLLGRHLIERWKIPEPRVALLVAPQLRPSRNLVIGRKRSEFADEVTADRQMEALLWYFPPGRSLVLMPEDWPEDRLTPLSDLWDGAV